MNKALPAIALIGVSIVAHTAQAMEYRLKDLTISHAWARATAGPARAGAAYLTIANHGRSVDRLVAVATPAAGRADVHTTKMDQGIMKMRPVKAVEVHPGEPTVLRPGGMHVMLMGLKAPLKQGESFLLTLTFETSGAIEVMVMVKAVGSMGAGSMGNEPWGRASGAPKGHRHGS